MSHDRQRGATSSLECYLTPTEKQQLILPIDLLHQLDNIFNENPNLDEIGIMYVDSIEKEKQKKNKTPAWCAEDAFVIPEPKKLGIAAWCLRPLFEAAKNRFERLLTSSSVTIPTISTTATKDGKKHREKQQQEQPNNQTNSRNIQKNNTMVKSSDHPTMMMDATRSLLILHPYSYSAWNARKSILNEFKMKIIDEKTKLYHYQLMLNELKYLDLVFTTHPKVGESWEHRSWCIKQIWQQQQTLSSSLILTPLSCVLSHEVDVCELIASRYPKNYYAWSHRQKVVRYMSLKSMVDDLNRTGKWCHTHVSDSSSFHHRRYLWLLLLFATHGHEGLGRKRMRKKWPKYVINAVNTYEKSKRKISKDQYKLERENIQQYMIPSYIYSSHYVPTVMYNSDNNRDDGIYEILLRTELDWNKTMILTYKVSGSDSNSNSNSNSGGSVLWSHRCFIMSMFNIVRPDLFIIMMKNEIHWMNKENNNHFNQSNLSYMKWVRNNIGPYDNQDDITLSKETLTWSFILTYSGRPFAGFQRQDKITEEKCPSVQGMMEHASKVVFLNKYNQLEKKSGNDATCIFPGQLMINGDRTDRGCNAVHHDVELMIAKIHNMNAFNVFKKITTIELCNSINKYLLQYGLHMVCKFLLFIFLVA
jgi:hypothetical protein